MKLPSNNRKNTEVSEKRREWHKRIRAIKILLADMREILILLDFQMIYIILFKDMCAHSHFLNEIPIFLVDQYFLMSIICS